MIPAKVKFYNLFVMGRGHAGTIESLTPPKFVKKMEEFRAGGMNAPVDIDLGEEKLEMSFVLGEYNPEILGLYGIANHSGAHLRLKASMQRDDIGGDAAPFEYEVRGRWNEVDPGEWKAGENTSLTVSLSLSYIKISQNGSVLRELDVENMIDVGPDGADRLEQHRKNIGV